MNNLERTIVAALNELREEDASFVYYRHEESYRFKPVILSGCWDFSNFKSDLYAMFLQKAAEVTSVIKEEDGDYRIEIIRHKDDLKFKNTIHFYINEKYFEV
jgi:hypothetical protein